MFRVPFLFSFGQKWVPISIWRNFGGRSNQTCFAFFCVWDAGNTGNWPPYIVHLDPRGQIRLVDWGTRRNKGTSFTVCVYVVEGGRGRFVEEHSVESQPTWVSINSSFRGVCVQWPRWAVGLSSIGHSCQSFCTRSLLAPLCWKRKLAVPCCRSVPI